jgi:uncharacterized protein YktA (UPF0223 family)
MANGDKQFSYPFLGGWSTADVIAVSNFYSDIAAANEIGVDRGHLLDSYKAFKEVVPSKAEEKQLDRLYAEASGYSIYKTINLAKETRSNKVKMENN